MDGLLGCLYYYAYYATTHELDYQILFMTGTDILYPPEYDDFQPPKVGSSYLDPVFGSKIIRVSDALATPNAANGGNLTWVAGEYSTICPFNSDKTRIILVHESYYGLYHSEGGYVGELPLEINASSEPKWSRTDNRIIYYVHGNQLKKYDVATEEITLVRTFDEYQTIKGKGESDISADGDHLVLVGDGVFVFKYQISTDRKSPTFYTGGGAFDSLYITPDNNVTITWNRAGTERYSGIELLDGDMKFRRQVTHAGGHMAACRDTDGSEVLIWCNSADPQPINCANGIVKVRLADGQQTCLLPLDWSLIVHVSAPSVGGFAYVETYAGEVTQASWKPYMNEILLVKLDGSEVKRLAHHRSRPHNSYNWQPRISCSRDGSRAVFNSNFNLQASQGYSAEYSDVYMLVLETATPVPEPPPIIPDPNPIPPPCPDPISDPIIESEPLPLPRRSRAKKRSYRPSR